jgi:hypothetical protein
MNRIDYIIQESSFSKNKNKTQEYFYQIKNNSFLFQNELSVYTVLKNIPTTTSISKTKTKTNDMYYIFESVEMIDYNEINKNNFSLEHSITLKATDNYLTMYKKTKFVSFEDIFNYYTNNIQSLRFLINSYNFLLNSIDLLIENNIVHNNISSSSIGINENNEPILFKFDLSMVLIPSNLNINYISKYFLLYEPTYFYRPLELQVLSYILSNNLTTISAFHVEKIIKECISDNIFIGKFGNNIKLLYEEEGRKYISKLINKPIDYIVSNIFQYKATWDNFRVSILYLQLIINTFHLSEPFMNKIMKMLLVNIHTNPGLRFTINKTRNILEEILYNTKCNEFKKIKLLHLWTFKTPTFALKNTKM